MGLSQFRALPEVDRTAAVALTIYESLFCPGCGQPKEAAWDPEADGWIVAKTVDCQGCAARERHAAEQKEPVPGEKVYVVDERLGRSD